MATSPDLAQPILQNLPAGGHGTVNFWDDEASVNGVWNGLLARFFPGTPLPVAGGVPNPMYIIAPEGQAATGSRPLRADLLVCEVDNPFTTLSPVLHFEGKRSSVTGNWDTIRLQIQLWFSNRGNTRLSAGRRVWAIGARGREWKAFIWNGSNTLQSLKLSTSVTAARQLVNDPSTTTAPYDISTVAGHGLAVRCLQYMSDHPFPVGTDIGS